VASFVLLDEVEVKRVEDSEVDTSPVDPSVATLHSKNVNKYIMSDF